MYIGRDIIVKFTKFMKGEEWEKDPKRYKSYKHAKMSVDRKKKTYRLREDNFYYRIKGKYGEFEVWYRVGKPSKY